MKTSSGITKWSQRALGRLAGIMSVAIVTVTWGVTTAEAAVFSENFESLTAGISIHGQNGWFVQPTALANAALVVNNPAVAFRGSQYLAIRGGGGDDWTFARHSLFDAPINTGENDVFSHALRFETKESNSFFTFWNANGGPFAIVHTVFNSQGTIGYFTNNDANLVYTTASIDTGTWYNVSYRALLSSQTVQFSVVRASDHAVILNELIPMNSAGTPATVNGFEFIVTSDPNNHWLVDEVLPVPEPCSLTLMLAAAAAIWCRHQKLGS